MKSNVVISVLLTLVLSGGSAAWAGGGSTTSALKDGQLECTRAPDCLQKGRECLETRDGSGKSDVETAAGYFVKACDLKEYRGCALAGIALREKNAAGSKTLLERACKSGDQLGCAFLGYGWNPQDGGSVTEKNMIKSLRKECKAGGPNGCLYLGVVLEWRDGRFPPRYAGFRPFYKKACDGGSGAGCELLGETYHLDIAGCENPDCKFKSQSTAVNYFSKGCDLGCARACRMLGEITTDPDEPEKKLFNPKRGGEALKRGCGLKDADSCMLLGDLLFGGKVVEKNIDEARVYYTAACEAGNKETCEKVVK